jgi:hypothetical protein
MITVEIVFRDKGNAIVSEPLEATKEEFLQAIQDEDFVDFPVRNEAGEIVTFCIASFQIESQCFLIFQDVQ